MPKTCREKKSGEESETIAIRVGTEHFPREKKDAEDREKPENSRNSAKRPGLISENRYRDRLQVYKKAFAPFIIRYYIGYEEGYLNWGMCRVSHWHFSSDHTFIPGY